MRKNLATFGTILGVSFLPSVVTACSPVAEAPLPIGLHDSLVHAFDIENETQRETAIENILREYLAHESREVVNQTVVYLWRNQRWIDLRRYEHLVASISPEFSLESWLAERMFDKYQLRSQPLGHRLEFYQTALIEGKAKFPHGSSFDLDDAARSVASTGLTDLTPLLEERFPETRMATRHGITFDEFMSNFELFMGATDWDSAYLLAVKRLNDINDRVFRERISNDDDFRSQARGVFNYVCAEDPFTGSIAPGCEFVLRIYIRQACFWFKSELKRREAGEKPSMPGPCGSHPISWLASLETHSFQGRKFNAHFSDAWKDKESCSLPQ